MSFKLSYLKSNLALTLGYLNPAFNSSAQDVKAEFYLLQLIEDQLQVSIRHLGTRRELEPKGVPQLFLG